MPATQTRPTGGREAMLAMCELESEIEELAFDLIEVCLAEGNPRVQRAAEKLREALRDVDALLLIMFGESAQ